MVEHEIWDDEGGHMSSIAGVVVSTPGSDMPFKAVLTHDAGDRTGRAFATMREAEAFIRRNTPRPALRSTLLDRAADEGLSSKPTSEPFP